MLIKPKLHEKLRVLLLVGKVRYFLLVLVLALLSSCASKSIDDAQSHYRSGRPAEALALLEDCTEVFEKDQLLCYMEKGSILFFSEKYEESSNALLQASQLLTAQDQISVIDQSSSVIVNDRTMEYKGEYAERLWVHTFLMLDFLLEQKLESALVEAKQAVELFEEYPQALKQAYFTRALVALCYENMGKFDDAKIEYQKIQDKLAEDFTVPLPPTDDQVEVVLFLSQGRIPGKIARDIIVPPSVRISLPEYQGYSPLASFQVEGTDLEKFFSISSNLGQVAKASLKDRVSEYMTRQVVRAGAKEALAQAAGQQNGLAEAAVRIMLFITEQADTRSWQTLPGGLTMVRLRLSAGKHDLFIKGDGKTLSRLNVGGKGGSRLYFMVNI